MEKINTDYKRRTSKIWAILSQGKKFTKKDIFGFNFNPGDHIEKSGKETLNGTDHTTLCRWKICSIF